jgi:hypothetical protein
MGDLGLAAGVQEGARTMVTSTARHHLGSPPAPAPALATQPAPEPALPPVLHWSISDAWTWLGHAWKTFIHAPYLGVVALILLAVVLLRAVHKLLG